MGNTANYHSWMISTWLRQWYLTQMCLLPRTTWRNCCVKQALQVTWLQHLDNGAKGQSLGFLIRTVMKEGGTISTTPRFKTTVQPGGRGAIEPVEGTK